MIRWRLTIMAIALTVAGCATWQKVVDRFTSDPVGSALVTLKTQWDGARQVMFKRDAAAIDACKALTPAAPACDQARCTEPVCVAFRTQYDPEVRRAYTIAHLTYEQWGDNPDAAQLTATALGIAFQGARHFGILDPGDGPLYAGIAAAIESAQRDLRDRFPTAAPVAPAPA